METFRCFNRIPECSDGLQQHVNGIFASKLDINLNLKESI